MRDSENHRRQRLCSGMFAHALATHSSNIGEGNPIVLKGTTGICGRCMRKKLMAKKYDFVGGIISQPILQLMKDTFPDAIKARLRSVGEMPDSISSTMRYCIDVGCRSVQRGNQ